MCSQVLDGLKIIIFVLKSNANLVITTTCMLLYLSRAIYIFECKKLSIQGLFLGELFQALISLARD
jgi:hypothetical protein